MPFAKFKLHPDLLRGVRELGFTRATPIQEQAIPPALEGQDVLACAMTGSGKTAAFLLPILHRLIGQAARHDARARPDADARARGADRGAPAASSRCTRRSRGAAVFGGVGMGPQEHAFRSGVDVIVATPGRLLDHFKHPYAKLDRPRGPGARRGGPDARHGLPARHPARPAAPAGRSGRRCSSRATMPPPIVALAREMLHNPATINLERRVGARRRHHARRSTRCRRSSSRRCSLELLQRGDMQERARLHAHQAPRQPARRSTWRSTGVAAERIHGNRSQAQRTAGAGRVQERASTGCWWRPTSRRAASTSRRSSHVVNFDVPHVPEDYIHRVGRTARAEATGDAFTFVSPEEEQDLRGDRAGDRQAAAARGRARLRLREQAAAAVRGPDRRADRRDPGAEGGGAARAKEKAERRAANAAGAGRSSPPRAAARPRTVVRREARRGVDGAEPKREGGTPRRRRPRGGPPRAGRGAAEGILVDRTGPYR